VNRRSSPATRSRSRARCACARGRQSVNQQSPCMLVSAPRGARVENGARPWTGAATRVRRRADGHSIRRLEAFEATQAIARCPRARICDHRLTAHALSGERERACPAACRLSRQAFKATSSSHWWKAIAERGRALPPPRRRRPPNRPRRCRSRRIRATLREGAPTGVYSMSTRSCGRSRIAAALARRLRTGRVRDGKAAMCSGRVSHDARRELAELPSASKRAPAQARSEEARTSSRCQPLTTSVIDYLRQQQRVALTEE